jgi:hypothetical protein
VEILRRLTQIDERESLDFIYDRMLARADVDLVPSDAAVTNLIKMMTYVDRRAASVDKSKLSDFSILKDVAQAKPPASKK